MDATEATETVVSRYLAATEASGMSELGVLSDTFTLRWHENGVPHAVHQARVVAVAGGGVGQDQAWCGGRWPAALLAEMAEAGRG